MSSNLTNRAQRKFSLKGALLISLAIFLPSLSTAQPTETRLSKVENCQFLAKVEGSSGYGRKYNWLRHAKASAIERAENAGASHIVWEKMIPVGVYNGRAIARVFNCNSH